MLQVLENTLNSIANDPVRMSNPNIYNIVNNLRSVVTLVKSLHNVIQSDQMLAMSLSGKILEIESTIAMYGNQMLLGGNASPPSPLMGGMSMYNQHMLYPGMMPGQMGQMQMPQMQMQMPQMQMQMPQMQMQMPQMQQMQQMPQMQMQPQQMPQMQQQMPVQQQPQQQAPVQQQPQQQAPVQQAPAQQPQPAAPPPSPQVRPPAPQFSRPPSPQAARPPAPQVRPPAPQAPAPEQAPPKASTSSGTGVSFGLPGGAGGGNDEKAAGRDYLLKLLSDK